MHSSEIVSLREDLEELIGTRGWKRFVQHVHDEWEGRGYVARMRRALDAGEIEAKSVDKASLEILRTVEWPRNQVEELKGVVEE